MKITGDSPIPSRVTFYLPLSHLSATDIPILTHMCQSWDTVLAEMELMIQEAGVLSRGGVLESPGKI